MIEFLYRYYLLIVRQNILKRIDIKVCVLHNMDGQHTGAIPFLLRSVYRNGFKEMPEMRIELLSE